MPSLMRLKDPLNRLMRGATHLRSAPIAAHIPIGGNHIHPFPRVLQMEIPFRGSSDRLTPSPSTAEGLNDYDTTNEEWGLSLATSGDR